MNYPIYNSCNYPTIDSKILDICSNDYDYFFNKPNVIGVGLGYKVQCGFITYEKCIQVFVTQKISATKLNTNSLIPTFYQGIKTDVTESGYFHIQNLYHKIRPVTGGYGMGLYGYPLTGTMGCLVKDSSNYYILSCNHIIAGENTVPIGTPILQPSNGRYPVDTIANLYRYIPLKFISRFHHPENYMDCAIAKVTNNTLVSNKITFLGNIKGIAPPKLGERIQKVGSTTELTLGNIIAIGATVNINFTLGNVLFKGQILSNEISSSGDSGAILLDSNKRALGLVMAGTSVGLSASNPIAPILSNLQVTLVT